MAHPATPEASAPPANSGNAVEEFADFLDTIPDEDEEDAPEGDDEPLEGDEPESDEEAQGEEDEPDEPAIDPPVSWGTDAKELFAQLTPDLQKQVVEREAQREKFVQGKATEAAEAKRSARIEAQEQLADTQRQYARQLEIYASNYAPQAPDPALIDADPVSYLRQKAAFEHRMAQHQQLMQQADAANHHAAQADQAAEQQRIQAEAAYLAQVLPEWTDDTQRQALLTSISEVGAELGYTAEAMAQVGAQDVLALKRAVEWKAKAQKYDALQKSKMDKVRSAKSLPKAVRPGVAPTRGEVSGTRAQAAWQNVKGARSKEQQADAFATFLETSGHL